MDNPWSPEQYVDAKNSEQLIWVQNVNSQLTNSRITIADLPRLWQRFPSLLFHDGYRLVASPEDITLALRKVNIASDEIENILNESITGQGYQTSQSFLSQWQVFAMNRKNILAGSRQGPGLHLKDIPAPVGLVSTRGRGLRGTSLMEKINNLPEDKVLSVSNLKPDGTGARALGIPSKNSKLIYIPSLKLASNNVDTIVLALDMLGGRDRYPDILESLGVPALPSWVQGPERPQMPIYRPNIDMQTVESLPINPMFTQSQRQRMQASPTETAHMTVFDEDMFPANPTFTKAQRHKMLTQEVSRQPLVDVFDLQAFAPIAEVFGQHFQELEFLLRTAIMINYIYNYLPEDQRAEMLQSLPGADKQRLEDLTNVFEIAEMIEKFYKHYNPGHEIDIEAKLREYIDCEDVLFNRLYKKYVNPNWSDDAKLWFANCQRLGEKSAEVLPVNSPYTLYDSPTSTVIEEGGLVTDSIPSEY